MKGLHLTADLHGCACSDELLLDRTAIARLCRRHTESAGLCVLDESWFTFPERQGQRGGVTGMLLLAESHLALHTWPEQRSVTLDVYVCNVSDDNSDRAESLMRALTEAYAPHSQETHRLRRGEVAAARITGHSRRRSDR